MTAVHFVVPDGIDDPARPSGGNTYDRRLRDELAAQRWPVHEHAVAGAWPHPDARSLKALDGVIGGLPDGAVVLLDGLIASSAGAVLVPHARRLRLVVLVHMALGDRGEQAVLAAAAAVVTTSAWTRRRLIEGHALAAGRVHVAEPGVDRAALAAPSADGGSLLCVAAVIFAKGHDVLVQALAATADLSWHCVCAGSVEREPAFVDGLRRRCADGGLGERVSFPGPRTGADLDDLYAAADLVILPSRGEAYGMVVTEALARGLPVLATDVGGVAEALGHGAGAIRPGVLVAPDDPPALGAALRDWLGDGELRERLRQAARDRRAALRGWPQTASIVAEVLAAVSR